MIPGQVIKTAVKVNWQPGYLIAEEMLYRKQNGTWEHMKNLKEIKTIHLYIFCGENCIKIFPELNV